MKKINVWVFAVGMLVSGTAGAFEVKAGGEIKTFHEISGPAWNCALANSVKKLQNEDRKTTVVTGKSTASVAN